MKRRKYPVMTVKPTEPKVIAVADDGAKKIDYNGEGEGFIAYDDCSYCYGTGRQKRGVYSMYQTYFQCDTCEGRYNHDRDVLVRIGHELEQRAESMFRQDKRHNGTDKASFAEAFQFEALAQEYRQIVKWIWNGAPEPAPFKEMTA